MIEDTFLSRQPIFDRHERVWGYELLSCIGLSHPGGPLDVIISAGSRSQEEGDLLLEKLAGGKRVLLNSSQEFFLREHSSGLPPEMVAREISPPAGLTASWRSAGASKTTGILWSCMTV